MTDGYNVRVKPVTTARKIPTEQQIRDTFQTPAYATRLLLPFIPKEITHVWECAAGGGYISRILSEAGYSVFETDIKEREGLTPYNFISDPIRTDIKPGKFSIITNPPFSIKDLFIERCFEYGVPFALLINADYSGWQIDLVRRGCEKIIPTRRIDYITPNLIKRVNDGENTAYETLEDIPNKFLVKYSASQFHSMWLTYGFNIGRTETFVDLPTISKKEDIL